MNKIYPITGYLNFDNRQVPIIDLPQREEHKTQLASDDVITQVQTGKRIIITPVHWKPGKVCDIRVTVEGITTTFSSLRTRSQFLTCAQLTAADNPAALIRKAVRELLDGFDQV